MSVILSKHTKLGKGFLAQRKSKKNAKYNYLIIYTTDQNIGVGKIILLLFSKDGFNWSKVRVKTIMLQKICFQIKANILNFIYNKDKKYHSLHKNVK